MLLIFIFLSSFECECLELVVGGEVDIAVLSLANSIDYFILVGFHINNEKPTIIIIAPKT